MSRRRATPVITQEQLDAELSALLASPASRAEQPRPGERSTQQWAALWGVARITAQERIARYVHHGLMRQRPVRTLTHSRTKLYPVPHYAYTPKARAALRRAMDRSRG